MPWGPFFVFARRRFNIGRTPNPEDFWKFTDEEMQLDAEMEVTSEDGYVGALRLDHTAVTTDGYATKTSTLIRQHLRDLAFTAEDMQQVRFC